ncbi:MAG: hypothetical protein V7L13_01170 [Nostoc sp.]
MNVSIPVRGSGYGKSYLLQPLLCKQSTPVNEIMRFSSSGEWCR